MDEQVGKILRCLDACGLTDTTRVLYSSDHGDNAGARGLWGKSTMYEESVGVPMILAGADVPAGRVCTTPVSLLDVFPTVLDALGHDATAPSPHGASLFGLAAAAADADRAVLSEYHASGSREAAVMLRSRGRKYVRYVTYPEQFFDLDADPEELSDTHLDAAARAALRARLDGMVDVAALDRAVKARQAAILAANGGRQAVMGRGDLPYSPPPGARAAWS
jgi:choline-sulfatase